MFSELKARLDRLGYLLAKWETDYLGRKWPYRTSPNRGNGGATCYFNTLSEVESYTMRVEQIREWQTA